MHWERGLGKSAMSLICGGGGVSYYLAHQLQHSRMHVKIIEKDYARCEKLTELLPELPSFTGMPRTMTF